jgi:hypothetical protein
MRRRKRDQYEHKIARLVQQRNDALEAALAYGTEVEELRVRVSEVASERDVLSDRLERIQGVLTVIQASLSEVAVYKGMGIGTDSVVLYVNELVRDHEELERRIDAAMLECAAAMDGDSIPISLFAQQIGRILQGGNQTPDTIEGIDEA